MANMRIGNGDAGDATTQTCGKTGSEGTPGQDSPGILDTVKRYRNTSIKRALSFPC
jgi:hypothetical protein